MTSNLLPHPLAPTRTVNSPILIVDDQAEVRAVVARLLARLGFSALLAGNGSEGLAIFQQRADTLHCVLLNLWMPYMNGASVCREMRRINPHVPVIMMSGYIADDIKQQCAGPNLAGVLEKPFTLAELRGEIEAVYGRFDRSVGD